MLLFFGSIVCVTDIFVMLLFLVRSFVLTFSAKKILCIHKIAIIDVLKDPI